MADKFEIGDVVEYIGHGCGSPRVGRIGIIVGCGTAEITCRHCGFCRNEFVYDIDYGDGYAHWSATPYEIRKKRPPEEHTSWDSVEKISGWRPREPETIEVMLEKIADGFNKWKALEHP